MADFAIAYRKTIAGNEGGYNPGIGEKETYEGIDRGANPHWSGWPLIDSIKGANPGISTHQMNVTLGCNVQLQMQIMGFYKSNYWDPIQGDSINAQQIANNLFDCSVNQGEGRARQIFQRACNFVIRVTNPNTSLLTVDGVIGRNSISAINAFPADQIYAEINRERDAWYRVAPNFSQWGKVWEARLIPYVKPA